MIVSQLESRSDIELELELESELESQVEAWVELEDLELEDAAVDGASSRSSKRLPGPTSAETLRTEPTTRGNLVETEWQAQVVPINREQICTLTNQNVIPITCITTEAVNTKNVLILILIFLGRGFLTMRCNIGRQTHVRSKGISMVIYPLHKLSLSARAAKIQVGEGPFQICHGALPIHPQTTTCLPEQAINYTLHTRRNYATPPFDMLLTLRELLQTAVSNQLLNCPNMLAMSSANGSRGNLPSTL